MNLYIIVKFDNLWKSLARDYVKQEGGMHATNNHFWQIKCPTLKKPDFDKIKMHFHVRFQRAISHRVYGGFPWLLSMHSMSQFESWNVKKVGVDFKSKNRAVKSDM